MRKALLSAAVASVLAISGVASAQGQAAPLEVKRGTSIYSSDGKRIGNVYDVREGPDGTPTTALVIYRSKMRYVPISSLSAGERGLVTSLSLAEVTKN